MKKIWLRILVLVLVLGMTVVGCGDDSTDDNNNGGGGKTIANELIGKWQAANSDGSLMAGIVNGVEFTSKTMKTINSTYPNGNTVSAYTENNNIYWGNNEWPYSISGDIVQITIVTPGVPQITTRHKKVAKFTWDEGNNTGGGGNVVLNGTTWRATNSEGYYIVVTFNSSTNWSMEDNTYDGQIATHTGTYTVSGNTITLTIPTFNGSASSGTQTATISGNTISWGGAIFTKQ